MKKAKEQSLISRIKCDSCNGMVTKVTAVDNSWLCGKCYTHWAFVDVAQSLSRAHVIEAEP
jgi:formylmethanofuran dehydrogenase subunit E